MGILLSISRSCLIRRYSGRTMTHSEMQLGLIHGDKGDLDALEELDVLFWSGSPARRTTSGLAARDLGLDLRIWILVRMS